MIDNAKICIWMACVLFGALVWSGCSAHVAASEAFQPEAFILQLKNQNLEPESVVAIGNGASYLTARFLQTQGRMLLDESRPEDFFLLSIQHDPLPFSREAAMHLLDLLGETENTDNGLHHQAIELIQETFPADFVLDRKIASLLYDLEDDVAFSQQLSRLQSYEQAKDDIEVLLWRIVLQARNEGEISQTLLLPLIRNYSADDVHWRLERYISFRDALQESIDPAWLRLLEYKAAISQRQFRGSAAGLLTEPWPVLNDILLWDVYAAAGQAGGGQQTAAAMRKLAESSDHVNRVTAYELAGRLSAQAGNHVQAQQDFSDGIAALVHDDAAAIARLQGQRMVWNWWRSGLRHDLELGLSQVNQLREWVRNPGYFNDLLHDLLSQLLRSQKWLEIETLYTELHPVMTEGMQARAAWILSEGIRTGFDSRYTRRELLRSALNQQVDPYYSMMAGFALGEQRELPLLDTPSADGGRFNGYDVEQLRAFAAALYDAELLFDGYRVVHQGADIFSLDELTGFAQLHHEADRYIDGMRLIDRALRIHQPATVSDEVVHTRYPLAFREEMLEIVQQYDLHPAVFYGLVREESYFDAAIESWVGATGLTQLMPATAGDMVRLLRLSDPDLTDPLTNLTIGGFYFQRLLKRFGSPVQALTAYNAGQGRVNRWRNEPWAASSVLFHESLPFEETRHYIRKIAVTAVHYDVYHFSGDKQDVISYLFPDVEAYNSQ